VESSRNTTGMLRKHCAELGIGFRDRTAEYPDSSPWITPNDAIFYVVSMTSKTLAYSTLACIILIPLAAFLYDVTLSRYGIGSVGISELIVLLIVWITAAAALVISIIQLINGKTRHTVVNISTLIISLPILAFNSFFLFVIMFMPMMGK